MKLNQWKREHRWMESKISSVGISRDHEKRLRDISENLERSKKSCAEEAIDILYEKVFGQQTDDSDSLDAMIAEIERTSKLLGDLLAAWRIAFPDKRRRTMREIFDAIELSPGDRRFAELGNAIAAFDKRSGGDFRECRVRSIANCLPLKHDRTSIINGLQLRTQADSRSGTKSYWVEDV